MKKRHEKKRRRKGAVSYTAEIDRERENEYSEGRLMQTVWDLCCPFVVVFFLILLLSLSLSPVLALSYSLTR